ASRPRAGGRAGRKAPDAHPLIHRSAGYILSLLPTGAKVFLQATETCVLLAVPTTRAQRPATGTPDTAEGGWPRRGEYVHGQGEEGVQGRFEQCAVEGQDRARSMVLRGFSSTMDMCAFLARDVDVLQAPVRRVPGRPLSGRGCRGGRQGLVRRCP